MNPMLATDLFVSNALGITALCHWLPIASMLHWSALRRYMSGRRRSSRGRTTASGTVSMVSGAAASLLDPSFSRALRISVGAGSGGTHSSLGGSPVPDLALVAFLDYVSGTLDEGDLGALAAVRFVRQSLRVPVSVSALLGHPFEQLLVICWLAR